MLPTVWRRAFIFAAFMAAITVIPSLPPGTILPASDEFASEPGYTPLPDIKDTNYLANYAGRFLGSRSAAETASIKAQIDAEKSTAPFRKAWLSTTLALDFVVLSVTMIVLGVRHIRRRQRDIIERSFDGAARGIVIWRNVKSRLFKIAAEVKRRADGA